MHPKYVYAFAEGDGKNKQLLGGKGANLCEMTQIGLNVPPGFVITTAACLKYMDTQDLPPGLMPALPVVTSTSAWCQKCHWRWKERTVFYARWSGVLTRNTTP